MRRISKEVTVVNASGIHARAAAKLSKLAKTASSNVWVTRDGEAVDASSILDILTLACAQGTTVTLEIDDPADMDVLGKLEHLVAGGFGED
jgi:phosphocarrier protein HPr